ncbi:MAG: hypothetical protein V4543_09675 [Bacteroidota bacterium]
MKKLLLLIILSVSLLPVFAQQREGAFWMFGQTHQMDFNYNPPMIYSMPPDSVPYRALGASASYCDEGGNHLFSVQNNVIYNKHIKPMKGGFQLVPNYVSTEIGATGWLPMIVKPKSSGSLYWVFYLDFSNNIGNMVRRPANLYRAIVDMSKENGYGEVISKNELIDTGLARQIAVFMHANNEDMWLLTHKADSRQFKRYLITDTLNKTPVVIDQLPAYEQIPLTVVSFYSGALVSSPNSELFVSCKKLWSYDSTLELYRLDRLTGDIQRLFGIKMDRKPTGYSFSADSKILYVGTGDAASGAGNNEDCYLYQLNLGSLDSATVQRSVTQLGKIAAKGIGATVMLGSDSKVYFGHFQSFSRADNHIGRINYPSRYGNACSPDFRWGTIFCQSRCINGYGFPLLNQTVLRNAYKLQASASADTICLGDSVSLYAYGGEMNAFNWAANSFLLSDTGSTVKAVPTSDAVFTVNANNDSSAAQATVSVKVVPQPGIPILDQYFDTIYAFSPGVSRFLWYANDTLIPNLSGTKIIADSGNSYRAKAISPGKCISGLSNAAVSETARKLRPEIMVLPNPTEGMFSIASGIYSDLQYTLYGAAGKIIRLGSLAPYGNIQIDLSDEPSGFYTMHAYGSVFNRVVKIIRK